MVEEVASIEILGLDDSIIVMMMILIVMIIITANGVLVAIVG